MKKTVRLLVFLFTLVSCSYQHSPDDKHTFPGSETSHYCLLGLREYQAGHYKEAARLYSHSFELDSTNTEAIYMRALSKGKLEDPEGAVSDYSILIGISPKDADAYCNRADEKARLSDNDGALEDYKTALKLDSTQWKFYLNLGAHQLRTKKLEDSIKMLSKAVELNPLCGGAFYNRALAREDLGQTDLACSDFKRALELGISEAKEDIQENCK